MGNLNYHQYESSIRSFWCSRRLCGGLSNRYIVSLPLRYYITQNNTSLAVSTLRPEFERIAEERDGKFKNSHETSDLQKSDSLVAKSDPNERVISQAMGQDFKEAGEQLKKSGFGWGFRALWNGENPFPEKKGKPVASPAVEATKIDTESKKNG